MTDLELITLVKTDNDSVAMKELIETHTGLYMNKVSSFCLPRAIANDAKEDCYLNIYKFAQKYDPSLGMKFSTYVAESTEFMCLNLLRRAPRSFELDEEQVPSNDNSVKENVNHHDDMEVIRARAKRVGDPNFYKIFCARFDGNKVLPWRSVAAKVGLTQEGARKCFNRHIQKIQEHMKT